MADISPNYVAPPNSGPEPAGLLANISERVFGHSPAAPPDPYALTDQQLIQLYTDTKEMCEPGRELFEWGWWRNLLYLYNRQWIYWNPSAKQWQDKRLAKWVPKPVTNMLRSTTMAIRAMLSTINLSVTAAPVGSAPANVMTAQAVDDLIPLFHDEHDMGERMMDADYWAVVLGNAFLLPYWNPDSPANTRQVPMWSCTNPQCSTDPLAPDAIMEAGQKCPNCGNPQLMPATNPDGSPVLTPILIGAGETLVVSPLELALPMYAQSFHKVDRLVYSTWRPRHEIEDEYEPDVVKRLNWTKSPSGRGLQLYRAIASISDLALSPSQWNTGAFAGQSEGAVEQHLWMKPSRRFPQGFYMRYLGEDQPIPARVTGTGPLPTQTIHGEPIWPWIHYPYERVTGRLYGQGAFDSVIQKQDQLNQIDAMTQLVIQRMGNPIWLEPKGAEVERFTGEPGLIVRYQTVGQSGAKPERIGGENPPQSFFTLRQMYVADIEEQTGGYDVLKGAQPSGVEAFSALQLLVERSQSRFSSVFKSRGRAYREWAKTVVELERVHGPSERTRAVLGPNNAWTFKTFQKASLSGQISIVVEDGTNIPKTALGRRAAIEHASQMMLLNPQDPQQQYSLLAELGLQNLIPALDADIKSALVEQDAVEEWGRKGYQGPMPLMRLPWHNDRVHLIENRKWMNSDAVRNLLEQAPPLVRQTVVNALAQHLMEHAQALAVATTPEPLGPGAAAPSPPGAPGASPHPAAQGPHGVKGKAAGSRMAMANSNQNAGATPPVDPQIGSAPTAL